MSKGLIYDPDLDPEMQCWRWPETRTAIRGDFERSVGPTLCVYQVAFEHPHVYQEQAYSVQEAIYMALRELDEDCAIANPQVESVQLLRPVTQAGTCDHCGQPLPEERSVLNPITMEVVGEVV